MSQINDALRRAQKNPPPPAAPPVVSRALPQDQPPAAKSSSPVGRWMLPVFVIVFIAAVTLAVGWAMAHRTVKTGVIAAAPSPVALPLPVELTTAAEAPPSSPAPASAPAAVPAPELPLNPPDAPKLQGIFYSPTAPSAIIDGKTVRPGDTFLKYRVKEIGRSMVTLVGPDNRAIRLGMGN